MTIASTEGLPKPREVMSGQRGAYSNALNFCRSAIVALVRSPCRYCPFLSELHALKIDLFLRQQGISVDQSDTSMYSTPYTCNFSDPRLNSGGDFRSLGGPAVPCFGFQLQRPKFRVSVSVPDPIGGAGLPGPIFANGRLLG
jgi:hypothetical protein